MSVSLIINFPTERDRDIFLGWMCDGGGEQEYMGYTDTTVTRFDYAKAFPEWGYNPEVDGLPVVETIAGRKKVPSCPICGSYEVQATGKPDEDNQCEYHCDDCGEYFVAEAIEEEKESKDE